MQLVRAKHRSRCNGAAKYSSINIHHFKKVTENAIPHFRDIPR